MHIKTVEGVLEDIGLSNISRLVVFNKSDLVEPDVAANMAKRYDGVCVCALKPETLNELLAAIEQRLWPKKMPGRQQSYNEKQDKA